MSVSQPGAGQQGLTPAQKAAAAGAVGTAAAAATPPAAAAGLATAAGIGATAVVAALLSFLTLLRETNKRWLLGNLGRYSRVPGDIAQVIEDEMRLEELFAQASSDRLAAGLPAALQIADPAQRAAAVRRLLDAEERYAQQRQEAMAARAIAAVTRAQLRRDSPLGAFWRLGRAKDHTPGCIVMAGGDYEGAGKFWPWAVLDRVHPPRHYGCTVTLHSFGEAIREGWMAPGDVPDTRAAIRAAAGVLMEEREAEALERELELRERLVEAGLVGWDQLASRPWEGVSEAFTDALHPRDWKGRFRSVGEVAQAITDTMIKWRGPLPSDAPSHEEIVGNWTRQVRGRLSKDRAAIGMLKAAQDENRANPRWQELVKGLPADHVIVTKPPDGRPRTASILVGHGEAASRKAHTTVITDEAIRTVAADAAKYGKKPSDHPAASSAYGVAGVLRHEYGHSIDESLSREDRRRILDQLPDAEKDLTYYAGTGDQEVIPELVALITHPDYRRADWPQSVQRAEDALRGALGVTSPAGPAERSAAALKRGEPAEVKPEDAPALIEALNDGELSSLHLLQVTGHPNLFRTHARDLTRAEMPQIRKADLPGFMDFLRQHRVGAVLEPRRPSELRATQNQINGAAVAALARGWDPTRGNVIMVSQEGDILDGHHRWAAAALDEMSHPERRMDTLRFSAGTDRILALMREYNELAGIESRPFARGSVPAGGVR